MKVRSLTSPGYLLAGSKELSPADSHRLAADVDVRIRRRLAENHSCPTEVLELLARDLHHEVRAAAAHNENLPRALLWQLSADRHVDVRYAIAANARMPQDVLQGLAQDSNPYVAWRARRTLSRVAKDAKRAALEEVRSAGIVLERPDDCEVSSLVSSEGNRVLRLVSDQRKPAGILMAIFLAAAWMVVFVYLGWFWWLHDLNTLWSLVILAVTLAFGAYLYFATARLIKHNRRRYEIVADNRSIDLIETNRAGEIVRESHVDVDRIDSAEVYSYADENVVVLRSGQDAVEIPLWPFGSFGKELIRALKSSGIPVSQVP